MATTDTELPIPQAVGERSDSVISVNPVEIALVRAPRELHENRYRLESPTFMGEKAVHLRIQ